MGFKWPSSLGLQSVILLVGSVRREEAVPGIPRTGPARAVPFGCPEQRAVTMCRIACSEAEKSCMPCRSPGAGPETLVAASGAAGAEWHRRL